MKKILSLLSMAVVLFAVSCTKEEQAPAAKKVESITLVPATVSLTVGGTSVIQAVVSPDDAADKSLNWSSSDPTKVIVSNGTVIAAAKGTVLVTATAKDGSGVSAVCVVTVTGSTPSPGDILVESITVEPTAASIAVGGTVQLNATVLPANATDKSLTWTSLQSNVAVVSPTGLVTGLANGSATIFVAANDASGKTATVTVNVTATPGPVPPTPGEEVLVNMAQTTIKTNAEMRLSTFFGGCDANAMGAANYNFACWFWASGKHDECPISSDWEMRTNRENKYTKASNLYDNDLNTSFHTNNDWPLAGDTGEVEPSPDVNFGRHFIQVTLPASAKQLKIQVTNDNCPEDKGDHTNVIGSEGVNIYVRANGNYVNLGTYQVSGAGATATFENITSNNQFIDEIRFERNCDPGWNFCGNNFGFAEMKIWTIGETGTAGAPSDVSQGNVQPEPHTPVVVARPAAPAGYVEVPLSSCEITTNNPMQYAVYGASPSEWNGGSLTVITPQQKANRQDLFDKVSNMWDGDAATSFHTNFDVYKTDYTIRPNSLVIDNCIDITLPQAYSNFIFWICNPTNGYYMGVCGDVDESDVEKRWHACVHFQFSNDGESWSDVPPYYDAAWLDPVPSAAPGSTHMIDGYGQGIGSGFAWNHIRIAPYIGDTSSGSFEYHQGYFGIAEFAIFAK